MTKLAEKLKYGKLNREDGGVEKREDRSADLTLVYMQSSNRVTVAFFK